MGLADVNQSDFWSLLVKCERKVIVYETFTENIKKENRSQRAKQKQNGPRVMEPSTLSNIKTFPVPKNEPTIH